MCFPPRAGNGGNISSIASIPPTCGRLAHPPSRNFAMTQLTDKTRPTAVATRKRPKLVAEAVRFEPVGGLAEDLGDHIPHDREGGLLVGVAKEVQGLAGGKALVLRVEFLPTSE